MWILDDDPVFQKEFEASGDQFDVGSLDMAFRHIKSWRTAIDGGAHYGTWTRCFGDRFQRVLAFEPRTDLFECLTKNVDGYSTVEINNAALGKELGSVTVGRGPSYHNTGTAQVTGPGLTPLLTIDSLNLTDVDFIKLDVEGYELYALQGAHQTLLRDKPVVHLEDKGHSADFGIPRGSAGKFLEKLGAKLVDSYRGRDFVYSW